MMIKAIYLPNFEWHGGKQLKYIVDWINVLWIESILRGDLIKREFKIKNLDCRMECIL